MKKLLILIFGLSSMLAFSQAGEAYDVLLLNPRASAPTNAFWTDGSLYRGNDGIIYHKVSGSWVPLGSAAENLVNVASGVIIGRTTAGSGNSEELSATQARALLNVEDGATADQTGAEIKAAYEGEANTNAFTDAEKTKLTGIETGATADQSDAEIETAYNNQVPVVSQVDAEAGTSTTPQRWTAERVAQAIAAQAASGSNLLPTYEMSDLDPTVIVADGDFTNKIGVTTLAGTYIVEIPADATFNHPVGTILMFKAGSEAAIVLQAEAGVTAPEITFVVTSFSYRKTAANTWELYHRGKEYISVLSPDQYFTFAKGSNSELGAETFPSSVIEICENCTPMDVIPTATWDTDNGAVAMDGWKGVDDRTIDEATWTFSDCGPGEKLTVWINRASAPTLAGSGLTFNPLPGNPFEANTEMAVYFEVGMDGTTIDYYYYLRE